MQRSKESSKNDSREDERKITCPSCDQDWIRFKVGDRLLPEECPRCHPAKVAPEDSGATGMQTPHGAATEAKPLDVLAAMAAAGFNVRKYREHTLGTFDEAHDAKALHAAERYVREWRDGVGRRWHTRPWAYFYGAGSKYLGREPGGNQVEIGALGNGKTLLAWSITRALLEEGLIQPGRFRFLTVEKLFLLAEATFRAGSETSEATLLEEFAKLDLLILDELGVRKPSSSHALRILDEITKARESNGLIWTGNLSLPVVEKWEPALKRVTDRIYGECGEGGRYIQQFKGPSRRLERARGES